MITIIVTIGIMTITAVKKAITIITLILPMMAVIIMILYRGMRQRLMRKGGYLIQRILQKLHF
jgi:trans-2-enoyl-CoA reductase